MENVNIELIKMRKSVYGNNFTEIKKLWNNYTNLDFKEQDVARMMALMKRTRIQFQLRNNLQITDVDDYNNYMWIAENYDEYDKL